MSHKEELEKLAKACEECSGKDSVSFDEHLDNCLACQEYKAKAEKLNQMTEAVRMLASKPDDERRKILNARMEQFFTMPAEKRILSIGDMLDLIGELSEEERIKITRTRMDIITSLPKQKRDIFMSDLKKVITGWPEERKIMEMRSVMAATQDYFILKRMIIRRMFGKMLTK